SDRKIIDLVIAGRHARGDASRHQDDSCRRIGSGDSSRSSIETLALRHQPGVSARSNRRFRATDRLCWLFLRWLWRGWREALLLIQPATVNRWHREGVRRCWRDRSRRCPADHASLQPSSLGVRPARHHLQDHPRARKGGGGDRLATRLCNQLLLRQRPLPSYAPNVASRPTAVRANLRACLTACSHEPVAGPTRRSVHEVFAGGSPPRSEYWRTTTAPI